MTEKEMVMLAQEGNEKAFASLYSIYKTKLYRYAYYRLGNEDDAQDAVSDAITMAFVQLNELRRAEAFYPWIFKILSASCGKYIKQQKDKREALDIDTLIDLSDKSRIPDGTSTDVKRALSLLSDKDREIVILSAVAGFNSTEIAKITGISSGNVRVRLSRALSKMRSYLE